MVFSKFQIQPMKANKINLQGAKPNEKLCLLLLNVLPYLSSLTFHRFDAANWTKFDFNT